MKPTAEDRIASNRRKAQPAHCPRCGRTTLTGLDGNVMAFTAIVEPLPTDAAGELAALVASGGAYSYHRPYSYTLNRRGELFRRGPNAVRLSPAGSPGLDPVHLDHVCEDQP